MRANKPVYIGLTLIAGAILCLVSCYAPPAHNSDSWNYNLASLYNPAESGLHTGCFVYHTSDTSSSLFFKVSKNEFVAYQEPENSTPIISVTVKYVLRDFETTALVDSGSWHYRVERGGSNDFISYVNIKTEKGKKYNLVVLFGDAVRKVSRRMMIETNRTIAGNNQHYFVETADSLKSPLFQPYVKSGRIYRIYNKLSGDTIYTIAHFKPVNIMPQSPFATTVIPALPVPDSVYSMRSGDTIRFSQKGIYFISTSKSPDAGLTLTNLGNEYPNIKTAEAMIEPLRYLTNARKWNEMMEAADKKLVLDKFWLSLTPDIRRSKELIRIYYNRVAMANELFGTYQPGWQTDRGMIYIIFGAPGTVYKGPDSEQWIYGDNPELSSIAFTFRKNNNYLSHNEYFLEREQRFQTLWSQAIETWLKGKAFSVN